MALKCLSDFLDNSSLRIATGSAAFKVPASASPEIEWANSYSYPLHWMCSWGGGNSAQRPAQTDEKPTISQHSFQEWKFLKFIESFSERRIVNVSHRNVATFNHTQTMFNVFGVCGQLNLWSFASIFNPLGNTLVNTDLKRAGNSGRTRGFRSVFGSFAADALELFDFSLTGKKVTGFRASESGALSVSLSKWDWQRAASPSELFGDRRVGRAPPTLSSHSLTHFTVKHFTHTVSPYWRNGETILWLADTLKRKHGEMTICIRGNSRVARVLSGKSMKYWTASSEANTAR